MHAKSMRLHAVNATSMPNPCETHPLRNQVAKVLPAVCPPDAAELPEVVVRGQAVVAVPLDVECSQVTAEWHATSEQEVLDLDVKIDVGELLGLGGHATAEEIKVVA
jgi:glucose-6-phosphate 1-dehydrogenase